MKRLIRLAALALAVLGVFGAGIGAGPFGTGSRAFAQYDAAAPPAGPQLAEPVVPVITRLEDGKVIAYVGTPRVNAYRIGDSIPVILLFQLPHNKEAEAAARAGKPQKQFDPTKLLADSPQAPTAPAAKPLLVPRINIEGLNMGVLSAQPSDVELVPGIQPVVQEYTDGDNDYMRVVFWVQSFVNTQKNDDGSPKTQASISADFLYAVDTLPDGQPDWKKASTPEIVVDLALTAGMEQSLMQEGDLQAKESTHAPVIPYLAGAGVVLIIPLVLALGWLGWAAYMRPRKLSPNEIFWREINPVIAGPKPREAFVLADYQKIMYELRRRYENVLGMPITSLYTAEVLKALEAQPHYKTIERVFSLEEIFYKKNSEVTPPQHEELMNALKLLVPRT